MSRNWLQDERERAEKMRQYALKVEEKEKELTTALSELARGVGIATPGQDWVQAMKRHAAEELARISLIRIPPRPYL